MNEHRSEVKRAAEELRDFCDWHFESLKHDWRCPRDHNGEAVALSTAGLLRTESDRLNAELAEAMVALREKRGSFRTGYPCVDNNWTRMCLALDAIMGARKPKERWTLDRVFNGWWMVQENGVDRCSFPPDTEPEARAYVARKNAEEAK